MTGHVLAVAVIRNGAKTLASDVMRITAALARSEHVSWFVVESDSDDGSVSVLQNLASSRGDFRFVSLGRLSPTIPQRTQRIATARNVYLRELAQHPAYADVEYVVMADLDGLNTQLTAAAVDTCFVRSDWDGVFANQSARYFDVWALRQRDWCPQDVFAQYHRLVAVGLGSDSAWALAVGSRQIHIPASSPWIEVDSAFGGFAIYRRERLGNHEYVGRTDAAEVCEHVAFHAALRADGARLFINPALINAGWVLHTRLHQRWRRPLRRIKRLLERLT